MQEPLNNPSQDADPPAGRPKLPTTFSQNPDDQPERRETAYSRYTSTYQASGGDSMETSLFLQANATLSIDEQLSSGWFSCYKYWLFFLAFPNIISLCYNTLHPPKPDSLILQSIQCVIEVAYAITMVFALKNKELGKAVLAFWLAIADFAFWIREFYIFVLGMRDFLNTLEEEGPVQISAVFIAFSICLFLWYLFYYILGIVIPAWKIKRLIEKREAVLQKDLDPYNV